MRNIGLLKLVNQENFQVKAGGQEEMGLIFGSAQMEIDPVRADYFPTERIKFYRPKEPEVKAIRYSD